MIWRQNEELLLHEELIFKLRLAGNILTVDTILTQKVYYHFGMGFFQRINAAADNAQNSSYLY